MRAFTLLVLGLALIAAPRAAKAQTYATIGDLLAANNGTVSVLSLAISAAGLDELVSDPDLVATVFAPTDEAFAAALAALNLTAEEILGDTELLTTVLSYHVVPGAAVLSTDLVDGQVFQTLLEGTTGQLQFYTFDAQPRLRTTSGQAVRIIGTDLEAGSAVVHLIDTVMLPGDMMFSAAPAPAPAA